jgi:photosystem II stability/assembly factor-like uncharacterized protein
MRAIFASFRAASVSALLTAVLVLGAAPSLSAQSPPPSWGWVFDYVNFVTRSDGWAMATNEATQNSLTELMTSHDGGRRWHDVTPPVVLAGEDAQSDNPYAVSPLLTPFILDSRHAWLPVGRSRRQQSSELDVFMTSDAGRRWVLRGRFPGADLAGIFFLSPSNGFVATQVGQGTSEDLVRVYATSDGGRHWREVSVLNDSCENVGGLSFASSRVGFLTAHCGFGWPGLLRTSDGGRRWGYVSIAPAYHTDYGGAYPAVFSSPQAGSAVVEVPPVLRIATTTDAGRHWDLRRLPPPAARLIRSANFYCPEDVSCLDLVSARTWVVGAGHDMYTTTDAGLSWRASPRAPYTPWGKVFNQLQLDFLSPSVGWAWYVGGSDLLWCTTDGGQHWSTYSLGTP